MTNEKNPKNLKDSPYRHIHGKEGMITKLDIDKIPDNLFKEKKPTNLKEIYEKYPLSTFQDLDKLSKVYDAFEDLIRSRIEKLEEEKKIPLNIINNSEIYRCKEHSEFNQIVGRIKELKRLIGEEE